MKEFKDIKGNVITFEEIRQIMIDGAQKYEYQVFVGTDSQIHRKIKKVVYATCIVVYMKGKGGRVFIHKAKDIITPSLHQRLASETWRSLETAFELQPLLPSGVELIIHVDVNKDRKYKSGRYHEELVGMVVGQGFKVVVKPDSWAAQHVADKFAR